MTNAQMNAIVKALAVAMNGNKAPKKAAKVKVSRPTGDEFIVALKAACVKLGFADPQPNVNILTYDKWLAAGRRVRKGEKSIRVSGKKSALFHVSQTDPETPKAS